MRTREKLVRHVLNTGRLIAAGVFLYHAIAILWFNEAPDLRQVGAVAYIGMVCIFLKDIE